VHLLSLGNIIIQVFAIVICPRAFLSPSIIHAERSSACLCSNCFFTRQVMTKKPPRSLNISSSLLLFHQYLPVPRPSPPLDTVERTRIASYARIPVRSTLQQIRFRRMSMQSHRHPCLSMSCFLEAFALSFSLTRSLSRCVTFKVSLFSVH
jgi:hypothetical protein